MVWQEVRSPALTKGWRLQKLTSRWLENKTTLIFPLGTAVACRGMMGVANTLHPRLIMNSYCTSQPFVFNWVVVFGVARWTCRTMRGWLGKQHTQKRKHAFNYTVSDKKNFFEYYGLEFLALKTIVLQEDIKSAVTITSMLISFH